MNDSAVKRFFAEPANVILVSLALAKLALHLFASAFTAYGYFRDELYYIACADHLSMGYVDQPPLSIYLLAVNRLLFGDSLVALHLPVALAGAATVFLSGLMARELGGGRYAQFIAAIAVFFAPIFLAMNCYYSMNSFDILLWTAVGYTLIRFLKNQRDASSEEPRRPEQYWLILGLLLGLGLLNKIDVLWLGAGITVALLLSPQRHWFTTRWPWMAGGIALLLFSPYIIWNLQHDLAHLEFIRHASGEKYSGLSPVTFIEGLVIIHNPLSVPLWIAGIVFFFLPHNKQFRPPGVVFVFAFVVLVINGHSKSEYLSPAFTILFAGGGVLFEHLLERKPWKWIRPVYAGMLIVGGCMLAPLALPLLPVSTYIHYAKMVGSKPSSSESKQLAELPQFYADMFGWKEKATAVAAVFNTLSPEEKLHCAIFSNNYGRCAAIDFFGNQYGLPPAIGNHNSYWIWGPGNTTPTVVIILGGNPEDHRRSFDEVTVADTVSCEYCMPYEDHLTISICRGLKRPLGEVWQQIKHYD